MHDASKRLREMAAHMDLMPCHYHDRYGYETDTVGMDMWLGLAELDDDGNPPDDCGTAGCIAGHTVLKYDGPKGAAGIMDYGKRAAFLLGLCAEEEYDAHMGQPAWRRAIIARSLFHPPRLVRDGLRAIDGAHCAKVLRWIADNFADETTKAADVRSKWLEVTGTTPA